MCSAANDDRRPGLCENTGENLTIDPFDTVIWHPDDPDPAFSPSSTDPDFSIPALISTAARSHKHHPSLSIDHTNSEGEDTLKERMYLSDMSHDLSSAVTYSESFSEPSTVDPPPLAHRYSSSSNPDASNYTHDPATPIMSGCAPATTVKIEETAWSGATGAMEARAAGKNDGSNRILSHRERNRIAAQKCRQKNKLNIQALQQQERHLAEQNKFLAEHAHLLKNEVLGLRSEILNHGNCDDEVIQNYIAETAKKLK